MLVNEQLNAQIRSQIKSGRFFNKFIHAGLGIKTKKFIMQHFGKIVAAVENPNNLEYLLLL